MHNIIIIPGLSGETKNLERITRWWEKYDLNPILVPFDWRDEKISLQSKLDNVRSLIDKLSKEGKVSLIGTSAGASAAFNLFLENTDKVYKAVNVCGRLRAGKHKLRSLDRMAASSSSFKESVLLFEKREPNISTELRKRLMTVSPMFGDELVPQDTSYLDGAKNIKIATAEHMMSISFALTLFGWRIMNFLRREGL